MNRTIALFIVMVCCLTAGAQTKSTNSDTGAFGIPLTDLDKVYRDESHCLTEADMRGDKDMPISCFCRDALVDARYVHFEYLLSFKDRNLNGAFLHLLSYAKETCGQAYDAYHAAMERDWKWDGPEVVRTYPPDEAIKRIAPEPLNGGVTLGRWVPFMVQLVYRDKQGHVARTENYSSREFIPDFDLTEKSKKAK